MRAFQASLRLNGCGLPFIGLPDAASPRKIQRAFRPLKENRGTVIADRQNGGFEGKIPLVVLNNGVHRIGF